MSNINKQALTDEAISKAFAGTNFGRDDFKNILAETVIDAAAGWRCGYTATTICTQLGLLTPKGCASALGLRFISEHVQRETKRLKDELEAKDRRIEEEIGRANREHHRGFMMACGHLKEHSNVHYADAAEMEIEALRNRINELESAIPDPVSLPDEVSWEDVPEEITEDDMEVALAWAHGFNQCREAMLQGAENSESLCTIHTAPALDSFPKNDESLCGNSPVIPGCWCRTCRPVNLNDMRFVVCPDCGNKRCPKANNHRNACTGSNEPGQEGSAYPAAPKQEAK